MKISGSKSKLMVGSVAVCGGMALAAVGFGAGVANAAPLPPRPGGPGLCLPLLPCPGKPAPGPGLLPPPGPVANLGPALGAPIGLPLR